MQSSFAVLSRSSCPMFEDALKNYIYLDWLTDCDCEGEPLPGNIAVVWREVDRFRSDPKWNDIFAKADEFLLNSGTGGRRVVMSLATFLRGAIDARGDAEIDNNALCGIAIALVAAKKGERIDWDGIGKAVGANAGFDIKQAATELAGKMHLSHKIKREFGLEEHLRVQRAEAVHEATKGENVVVDIRKSEARRRIEAVKDDPEWADHVKAATRFIVESGADPRASTSVAAVVRSAIDAGLTERSSQQLVSAAAAYIVCRKNDIDPGLAAVAKRMGVSAQDLEFKTKEVAVVLNLPVALKVSLGVETQRVERDEHLAKVHVIVDEKKAAAHQKLSALRNDENWKEPFEAATGFLKENGCHGQAWLGVVSITSDAIGAGLDKGKSHLLVASAAACIFMRKKGKSFGSWQDVARRLGLNDAELKSAATQIVDTLSFPGQVKAEFGVERRHAGGRPPLDESRVPSVKMPSIKEIVRMLTDGTNAFVEEVVDVAKHSVSQRMSELLTPAVDKAMKKLAVGLRKEMERSVRVSARDVRAELSRLMEERRQKVGAALDEEAMRGGILGTPLTDAAEGGLPSNLAVANRLELELAQINKQRRAMVINCVKEFVRLYEIMPKNGMNANTNTLHTLGGDMLVAYYGRGNVAKTQAEMQGDATAIAAAALYYAARKAGAGVSIHNIAEISGLHERAVYTGLCKLSAALSFNVLPDTVEEDMAKLADESKAGGVLKAKARAVFLMAFNYGIVTPDNERAVTAASFYLAEKMLRIRSEFPFSGATRTNLFDYGSHVVTKYKVVGLVNITLADLERALEKLVGVVEMSEHERGLLFLRLFGRESENGKGGAANSTSIKWNEALADVAQKLRKKYPLTAAEADKADKYFLELRTRKVFTSPGGIGWNVYCGALLFIAAAENGVPITKADVWKELNVHPRVFTSTAKRLSKTLGVTIKQQPEAFVHEVLRRYNEGYSAEDAALKIIRTVEAGTPSLFYDPLGVAAAAVYIAIKRRGGGNSDILDAFSRAVNYSPKHLEDLVNWMQDTLEQAAKIQKLSR